MCQCGRVNVVWLRERVRACVCVCVFVCVSKRERERDACGGYLSPNSNICKGLWFCYCQSPSFSLCLFLLIILPLQGEISDTYLVAGMGRYN